MNVHLSRCPLIEVPAIAVAARQLRVLAESLTNIAATHAADDVYDGARRQFSEKELVDLSIAIAMINAWNRLAIGARSVHPGDLAKAA